jgi:hypothetical protein
MRHQLDFFPVAREIETLNPRATIGPGTAVEALYRVRYANERAAHQVFRDKHGLYCGEHGTDCEAVYAVRDLGARRNKKKRRI